MSTLNDEDPADPSVHEPRVTGAPDAIWLVYGELEHDDTHANCCANGEVTWCESAQFPADVRYLRADTLHARREVAQRVAEALIKLINSDDGTISKASDADLEEAVHDREAPPIVRRQAAAMLNARAAVAEWEKLQ